MVRRSFALGYACAAYALFVVTLVYSYGFVANLGTPTALDTAPAASLPTALAIDLGLLAVFALQHSGMARPGFKRAVARVVPPPIERATYVLASCLALLLLCWQWRPIGGTLWEVQGAVARVAVQALAAVGWLTVGATTFLISHFDLFGLRQAWLYFRCQDYTPPTFRTPGPYRLVRHPLYVGWLIAVWAAPTMTVGHLAFALGVTVYILGAVRLEERDLADAHPEYHEYRRQVPMLVPALRWLPASSLESDQVSTASRRNSTDRALLPGCSLDSAYGS